MDKDTVIKVENLHKKFCRSLKRSMFYGSVDVARDMLGIRYNPGCLRKNEFWALKDISFEVKKGETFGLIGANGSGKTTLLRLINGIFPPDRGKIMIKGRIGALIAVGAGFHPHMTGRENIYLNGSILGMTQAEIRKNMDSIINFAEIGDFLDAPVSTYSSGMYVRLGFAIAIHSRPDIVLVDEILAVGDSKFQRKCLDKIKEMRARGTTFFLVSHNMQNIEAMCNRAILMSRGKQLMLDSPEKVIPEYELMLQTNEELKKEVEEEKILEKNKFSMTWKCKGFGTDEIDILKFELLNEQEKPASVFRSDDRIEIKAKIFSKKNLENVIIFLRFFYIKDKKIYLDNPHDDEIKACLGAREKLNIPKGKSTVSLTIPKTQLSTGVYVVDFRLYDETFSQPYFQGEFGYLKIKKEFSSMLQPGKTTPYCWINVKARLING